MTAQVAVAPLLLAVRALAEPHRLALVRALRERERCVRDLVAATGLAQPLVSHHLGRLADAGLVTSRHGDGYRYYALHPAGVRAAAAALADLLDVDALPAVARPGGGEGCCQ